MMQNLLGVFTTNKTKRFAKFYKGLTAYIGRELQTKFVNAFDQSHYKLAPNVNLKNDNHQKIYSRLLAYLILSKLLHFQLTGLCTSH